MAAAGNPLISILNVKGTNYDIKDAKARSDIEEIQSLIAGGVHFRGVSDTAITDGEAIKDLTVDNDTYPAEDQIDGDIFIYNNGTKNLEFIVSNAHYSELGSTGQLGTLAYANEAVGTATVNVASAITFNTYTPNVTKGTLAVTTTEGSFSITTDADTASGKFSPAAITVAAKTCEVTTTATAASASGSVQIPAKDIAAAACSVTTTATAASVVGKFSPAAITVAASAVTITPTTDTFTALADVTYDSDSETLTISDVTSSTFWTGVESAEAAGQTVTQAANQTVSVQVTYEKVSAVTTPAYTISYALQSVTVAVTYDKVTAVTAPGQTVSQQENQDISVTYQKVTAADVTYLTAASLTGDLTVTGAKPTATITNPTVTVTVSPVSA